MRSEMSRVMVLSEDMLRSSVADNGGLKERSAITNNRRSALRTRRHLGKRKPESYHQAITVGPMI